MSLSWARVIQAMYLLTSWISILKLSSHLRLGLTKWFIFLRFSSTTVLYTPFLYPILGIFPAHLIFHDLIFIALIIFGGLYRSQSCSLCSLLHSPITSSVLGPNTFFSTLFSNTLSLRAFLNVKQQVSHPYKTTWKTIILYILIFIFLGNKLEDKTVCKKKKVRHMIRNVAQISCPTSQTSNWRLATLTGLFMIFFSVFFFSSWRYNPHWGCILQPSSGL